MLINNAGIQRRIDLRAGEEALTGGDAEISTNLTAVLLPVLQSRPAAAVVNVGSGLGIVPVAAIPVYSATKAALHAYTRCLRHQLRGTSVRVFDVLPPAVDTELDQGARAARGETARTVSPEAVAEAFWQAWCRDQPVVAVGMVKVLLCMSRLAPDFIFTKLNSLVKL
ncbi:SDR family NAD(P)-dependent oxidoreductase [Hymenobacter roseosalivarius]|uniref:SDR family NAD(P)-dependent oxidoreductase n=1 Tax=Hymenobacter roseosalivarius TaxID=89967 RepID=UPI0021CDE671|nr:SDR family NAD(P)-dependent oxidoreductase [Hymenobacter roseosalivarius]